VLALPPPLFHWCHGHFGTIALSFHYQQVIVVASCHLHLVAVVVSLLLPSSRHCHLNAIFLLLLLLLLLSPLSSLRHCHHDFVSAIVIAIMSFLPLPLHHHHLHHHCFRHFIATIMLPISSEKMSVSQCLHNILQATGALVLILQSYEFF